MEYPDRLSSDPVYRTNEVEAAHALTEHYTRLAAQMYYSYPNVVAVYGAPRIGELRLLIDAANPCAVLDRNSWLFFDSPTIRYFKPLNTAEFGVVFEIELQIESDEVAVLDTSDTEEYPDDFGIEEYIESEIDASELRDFERLPADPVDWMDTVVLSEEYRSSTFAEYHPMPEEEFERDVRAWRRPDGTWMALYKLRSATAETCYESICAVLEKFHSDSEPAFVELEELDFGTDE